MLATEYGDGRRRAPRRMPTDQDGKAPMFSPLRNPAYRRLFLAQVAALLGTGLATVALGLLAHKLAGASAGEVLGTALGIKMVAYVLVAPFASALAARLPRKTLLVSLDLVRAGVAICLPFVGEASQVYALMTVLHVASAAFTPAFQAMIPDLLSNEADYTKALSLSRLAADLESIASPTLAAVLLLVLPFSDLFGGTALGFVLSATLVLSAALPVLTVNRPKPFLQRLTGGLRLFAHTPRLRGLLAISMATAAGGAMVFVNTVVLVQSDFGLGDRETAWALGAFGLGSIFAAAMLAQLADGVGDRSAMLTGGGIMTAGLFVGPILADSYPGLLALWIVIGFGYSLTITPSGRTLRRSAHAEERPALFAAQFALSHACWLLAYPLAGLISARTGTNAAFVSLASLSLGGILAALLIWPVRDPEEIVHSHAGLAPEDPHRSDAQGADVLHVHPYVIDDRHRRWPKSAKR